MISNVVKCDVCGQKIDRERKDQWHNINVVVNSVHADIVKEKEPEKKVIRIYNSNTASFHVCSNDMKIFLQYFLGAQLEDEYHKEYLKRMMENKLNVM